MKYYVVDSQVEADALRSQCYQALLDEINASTEEITVNLPLAGAHVGVTQHKNLSSNTIVKLTPPIGTMIDGETNFVLDKRYEGIGVYSDGSNYYIQ
jgi:hypothetical protein